MPPVEIFTACANGEGNKSTRNKGFTGVNGHAGVTRYARNSSLTPNSICAFWTKVARIEFAWPAPAPLCCSHLAPSFATLFQSPFSFNDKL